MKVKKAISYKIKCEKCGSILEFNLDELVEGKGSYASKCSNIICPVCDEENLVLEHQKFLVPRVEIVYEEQERLS